VKTLDDPRSIPSKKRPFFLNAHPQQLSWM
jgi:hypothetical protein